jgi:hypothetical protein
MLELLTKWAQAPTVLGRIVPDSVVVHTASCPALQKVHSYPPKL